MNAAKVLEDLKRRFPNEPEYHQAVEEVLSTIEEEYNKHPEFDKVNLIERLCIPDRVYQFRVTWMDDKGNTDKHGLSRSTQQRYRSVQRWYPFPRICEPLNPKVPRVRTNLQKLSDYSAYGWW